MVNLPSELIEKWQDLVDAMAGVLDLPAGLIVVYDGQNLEVLLSSRGDENPFQSGFKDSIEGGTYCAKVIQTEKLLVVVDALKDEEWREGPDAKLGLIAYLGAPIRLPGGDLFGTLCCMDNRANSFDERASNLMIQLRDFLEAQLELHLINQKLEIQNVELHNSLSTVKTLRGILPLCSHCHNIRTKEGAWKDLADYVSTHSEAQVSHGLCPRCIKKHYSEEVAY